MFVNQLSTLKIKLTDYLKLTWSYFQNIDYSVNRKGIMYYQCKTFISNEIIIYVIYLYFIKKELGRLLFYPYKLIINSVALLENWINYEHWNHNHETSSDTP